MILTVATFLPTVGAALHRRVSRSGRLRSRAAPPSQERGDGENHRQRRLRTNATRRRRRPGCERVVHPSPLDPTIPCADPITRRPTPVTIPSIRPRSKAGAPPETQQGRTKRASYSRPRSTSGAAGHGRVPREAMTRRGTGRAVMTQASRRRHPTSAESSRSAKASAPPILRSWGAARARSARSRPVSRRMPQREPRPPHHR